MLPQASSSQFTAAAAVTVQKLFQFCQLVSCAFCVCDVQGAGGPGTFCTRSLTPFAPKSWEAGVFIVPVLQPKEKA